MLEDDIPFEANLDDVLSQRRSRGARWGRAALVGLAVVVGGAMLVALLGRAATGAPSTAQHYHLALGSDITWGTFTLTGSVHKAVQNTGQVQLSSTLTAPAQITITLAAPPFATKACHLSLPPAPTDSCRASTIYADNSDVPLLGVSLPVTLADLPAAMAATISNTVIPPFLAATEQIPIPVGTHYALDRVLTADYVATEPLTATISTTPGDPALVTDAACRIVCGRPGGPGEGTTAPKGNPDLWLARIYIQQHWRIARRDGTALGGIIENISPRPLDFDLVYTPATGQWAITPQYMQAASGFLSIGICEDGSVMLQSLYFTAGSPLAQFNTTPADFDHHLNGCLLRLHDDANAATADFLWRLGRLYAANATAHFVAPGQPLANAADLAALG